MDKLSMIEKTSFLTGVWASALTHGSLRMEKFIPNFGAMVLGVIIYEHKNSMQIGLIGTRKNDSHLFTFYCENPHEENAEAYAKVAKPFAEISVETGAQQFSFRVMPNEWPNADAFHKAVSLLNATMAHYEDAWKKCIEEYV